jgi:hypothetical protein
VVASSTPVRRFARVTILVRGKAFRQKETRTAFLRPLFLALTGGRGLAIRLILGFRRKDPVARRTNLEQDSGVEPMKSKSKYDLTERITRGIKIGVAQALEAHRQAGEKVAIWRDGRVVEVLPPRRRQKKA